MTTGMHLRSWFVQSPFVCSLCSAHGVFRDRSSYGEPNICGSRRSSREEQDQRRGPGPGRVQEQVPLLGSRAGALA